MSSPSKAKGVAYERELVEQARAAGLEAVRAWASNGKALGLDESVDVQMKGVWGIQGCRVQAKRRARFPKDLKVPGGCDAVCFREDRGQTWVVLRWEDFLLKLKDGW